MFIIITVVVSLPLILFQKLVKASKSKCLNPLLSVHVYSCVQNNSGVFKKASKAQNPYNNFYFNTHIQ